MRDDPVLRGSGDGDCGLNRMINNEREVMDRDLLIYDHTLRQQIYSMPTEKAARPGSFTEATEKTSFLRDVFGQ